jgi:hypothetical protein
MFAGSFPTHAIGVAEYAALARFVQIMGPGWPVREAAEEEGYLDIEITMPRDFDHGAAAREWGRHVRGLGISAELAVPDVEQDAVTFISCA